MIHRVCTYFDPLGIYRKQEHEDTLALWAETWIREGFNVHILSRANAQHHPRFEQVLKKAQSLPTTNPRPYEEACFIRWCAVSHEFSNAKVAFMDYDIFPTFHFEGFPEHTGLTNLGSPPSILLGTGPQFEELIDGILSFDPAPLAGHVSDMTILQEESFYQTNLDMCRCYGTHNWRKRQLVHFANWTLLPTIPSRAEAIKSFMGANGRIAN